MSWDTEKERFQADRRNRPNEKTRFSEAQIVSILKEADAGMKVANLCRKHGVSEPTYYKWKSKYGGP